MASTLRIAEVLTDSTDQWFHFIDRKLTYMPPPNARWGRARLVRHRIKSSLNQHKVLLIRAASSGAARIYAPVKASMSTMHTSGNKVTSQQALQRPN